MTLYEALRVLALVHTATDHRSGFVVEASPPLSMFAQIGPAGRYVDAWETVRRELGLPVDPPIKALADAIPEAMPQG